MPLRKDIPLAHLAALADELAVVTSQYESPLELMQDRIVHPSFLGEIASKYPLTAIESQSSSPESQEMLRDALDSLQSVHEGAFNDCVLITQRICWSDPVAQDMELADLHRSFQRELAQVCSSVIAMAEKRKENAEESDKSGGRKRRFGNDARHILEAAYLCKDRPNRLEKDRLAKRCGLTPRQVGVWFSNRRSRGRTEKKDVVYYCSPPSTNSPSSDMHFPSPHYEFV